MLTYFSWLLIRPGYPICGKCTYWLRFLAMPRVPASCAYTQKWLFVCLTVIFYYFLVNCCINLYMYVCALTNIHMRKGLRNFHTTLLVLRVFFFVFVPYSNKLYKQYIQHIRTFICCCEYVLHWRVPFRAARHHL